MISAVIGRRGYVTIPSSIRRQLGLKEGDRIALVVQDDQIILRPITQSLRELRGSVAVDGPQDFSAIRRQVLTGRGQETAADER